MKEILRNIRLAYNDVRNVNRVTFFFVLLVAYYILNLLTSPITSGMSGGLEADHNIVNQLSAGIFVGYVLFYDVFTSSKRSYMISRAVAIFLIYVAVITYVGFATDTAKHNIFSFSSLVNLCYWGCGLIFCIKFFNDVNADNLKRMIQMLVWVFLVFVTYRLFTQKALLRSLGISMGINAAASTYMIIPLIIMVFKGRLRFFLFLFCTFICIYSAKRQAVVGLVIVSLFSLRILYQAYVHKRRFIMIIMFFIALYLGSGYLERMFYDIVHRQERLVEREDEDSGRFALWTVAMSGFQNSDNTTQWFGGGPGTGRKYIGAFYPIARAPHNGYIQVLCDYGYIGLMLYAFFFLALLFYVFKVKGLNNKLIYLSIGFSWIFANSISHPGSLRFIFLAIGVGYVFYMQNNGKDKVID